MTEQGRCLHVVTASQRRGAEVFALDLVTELRGQGRTDELVALTPGSSDGGLGVPTLGDQPYALSTLRALRAGARGRDVVVAHGSKTLLAAAVALPGLRVPFVYRSIGDPMAWSGSGVRRARTALLLRRAARVVALWPGAADVLTRVHGVPTAKLAVIPNGVPASRCPLADATAQAAARRVFGLPDGEPVVTYLGALSPEKQVDTAIRAVAALPDVHLLVAGGGPDRAALESLAEATAPGRVHFAGPVDGPREALAAGDAVILPSRTEGMPGVLIEAGLTGRAAVASDVGGIPEIVRAGETGLLAPPGDVEAFTAALRTVLADAEPFGKAAHQHCVDHFDIAVVARHWSTLLTDVG
ncbi:MAG TPA: glycosyltransferase family 4 protein [Acidimicrobiales bacterium]|nr:glycosyltransferase family 4 protein [Acidimicrobiales bacterium]